jgi:hypothetical protein
MSQAYLILAGLDLLLTETAASNSARIMNRFVYLLTFLFSQMKLRPAGKMVAHGRRKGSSAKSSILRVLSSVMVGLYDLTQLTRASPKLVPGAFKEQVLVSFLVPCGTWTERRGGRSEVVESFLVRKNSMDQFKEEGLIIWT